MPTHLSPEWYVISLRPVAGHAGLRRAAARHGAGLIALSPWRLRPLADARTRAALRDALAALRVIFSSPAAVRAAQALQPLAQEGAGRRGWFAVGTGTAAALRRAGVEHVHAPRQMHSEGLLALPGLQTVAGSQVGLVTAPGGRDRITTELHARGAMVLRADVYRREPVPPAPRAIAALCTLHAPAVLALSSGQALARVLEALPDDAARALRGCAVVAASARLADVAGQHGFARIVQAAGPRPAQLLAAAQAHLPSLAAGRSDSTENETEPCGKPR